MRELVLIRGGRRGNQVGAQFWEVISVSAVSILQGSTTVTPTGSSSALLHTTTRQRGFAMVRALSCWTPSRARGTAYARVWSGSSPARTTSVLVPCSTTQRKVELLGHSAYITSVVGAPEQMHIMLRRRRFATSR